MAKKGQLIDELYISLGLDIASLQLDFDTAGKTVSNAISKINSETNKIKLRMDTDLSKLDGVGSELDKIRVKYEAINKQLDLQRQKESILAAVMKDAQKNSGIGSGAANKAETDLLRQQRLIAQTEAEIRKLAAAMSATTGKIRVTADIEQFKTAERNIQESIARMNAKIQNIRLKADVDLTALRGANAEVEREKVNIRALNQELEIQNQKLKQLQNTYNLSAKAFGKSDVITISAQSNVYKQLQEIERLQGKLRELEKTPSNVKIKVDTSGMQQAERNIQDSISRMNAKIQNIRVKAEVDISGLNAGATAADRQRIAVQALNKELEIQQQKLIQLQNAYNVSQKVNGTNGAATLNASTDVLRQRQTVQRLEGEIRNLNTSLSQVGVKSTGFGVLANAAGAARTKVAGVIDTLNGMQSTLLGLSVAAAGLGGLFGLTESAMKAGHETYKLATRLHTTTAEASALKRTFGLVDIDVNAAIPLFARLGKQMTSAGENGNALTQAAESYGFTLADSSGKLLPYTKMLDELAKGYRNAAEAGDTVGFVTNVLGARGAMLEPLLADYEFLIAASKDVQSTGLLNPQAAEDAYREYKKMSFELGQLKNAAGAALLPITKSLMPEVVEGFKTMIGFIKDNKDGIQGFGELAGEVFGGTAKAIMSVVSALGEMKKGLSDVTGAGETESILRNADIPGLNQKLDRAGLFGAAVGGAAGTYYGGAKGGVAGAYIGSEVFPYVSEQVYKVGLMTTGEWDYYKQKSALIEQEKAAQKDLVKIQEQLAEEERGQARIQAMQKVAEVQNRLEEEMATATSSRLQEKLEAIKTTTEQSIAEGNNEAAAWQKAEKDISKAIKEAREEAEKANEELKVSIYELTHTDLQNKLARTDDNEIRMTERGGDPELVRQEAELQRLRTIRDFNNDVAANIDSVWQTALEKRLSQIEREKQAWIDKGLEEVKATQWAEEEKANARRDAALNEVKQRSREIEAFNQGGYAGLRDYQLQQLQKSGVNLELLNMTPERMEDFQKARLLSERTLMPYFSTAEDWQANQALLRNAAETSRNGQAEMINKILDGITIEGKDLSEFRTETGERTPLSVSDVWRRGEGVQPEMPTIQRFGEEFENTLPRMVEFSNQTAGAGEQLGILTSHLEGVNPQVSDMLTVFSELTPDVEDLSGKFADLTGFSEELVTGTGDFSANLKTLNEKLNEFTRALQTPSQTSSETVRRTQGNPVSVSVNVQIEEAHAWDTAHIEELADRVAGVIEPEVTRAIGGDGNSY